jgi:hypothetical protein
MKQAFPIQQTRWVTMVLVLTYALLQMASGQPALSSASFRDLAAAATAMCPLTAKEVATFDYRTVRSACGESAGMFHGLSIARCR